MSKFYVIAVCSGDIDLSGYDCTLMIMGMTSLLVAFWGEVTDAVDVFLNTVLSSSLDLSTKGTWMQLPSA
ncbi:MAG: hypothetical protein QS748_14010 [Candidatus Endonucleobacter bathymodioli]|uniref:Uncharacterized protein n=1 Tax=Candidatus Endonucleibacter bathymodioli TaxID=539814 RepID=A0AA90SZ05_9GAMM|nr:hypothetical protein [Candidatus Endonucleobacter bathymodioli]